MNLTWVDRLLTETSVYWDPPIRDGLGGYTWGYPQEIKTRWQNTPRLVYDPNGAEIQTSAEVWVTKDIISGGYIWRGTINDIQTVFEPDPDFALDNPPIEKIRNMAAQIVKITRIESLVNNSLIFMKALLI